MPVESRLKPAGADLALDCEAVVTQTKKRGRGVPGKVEGRCQGYRADVPEQQPAVSRDGSKTMASWSAYRRQCPWDSPCRGRSPCLSTGLDEFG